MDDSLFVNRLMDNIGHVACAPTSTPEVDQHGGDDCNDNDQKGDYCRLSRELKEGGIGLGIVNTN